MTGETLPQRFRTFWTQTLFAGPNVLETAPRFLSLLLLVLLPAALLYPTRDFYLLEPDEGRYAQIPREMLLAEDWVVPRLQGEPYLDKPPLFYWLVMLSYRSFGISPTAARLVPAVALHLAILGVYLIGRRSVGERSAFWAGILLTLGPGFMGMGRLLILDGLLTCCVTLMLLCAFEAWRTKRLRWGWWFAASICCGLGILTKGPIALILLLGPMGAWRWLQGESLWPGWKPLTLLGTTLAAVNLPWYIAIYQREPIFLRYFLWEHNVLRFLKPFDHLEPVWFYVPILLGCLIPVVPLLPSFLNHLSRCDAATVAQRSPALGFWLLAGSFCVAFFSLSGCKLPTYILPALPCFALAIGEFIARSHWAESRWTHSGIVVTAALLAFMFEVVVPFYAERRSPVARPELLADYVGTNERRIFAYPGHVDSIAFYNGRSDVKGFKGRHFDHMIQELLKAPQSVVLFTNQHALEGFKQEMPRELRIVRTQSFRLPSLGSRSADRIFGTTPWGLSDAVIVEVVPMDERPIVVYPRLGMSPKSSSSPSSASSSVRNGSSSGESVVTSLLPP